MTRPSRRPSTCDVRPSGKANSRPLTAGRARSGTIAPSTASHTAYSRSSKRVVIRPDLRLPSTSVVPLQQSTLAAIGGSISSVQSPYAAAGRLHAAVAQIRPSLEFPLRKYRIWPRHGPYRPLRFHLQVPPRSTTARVALSWSVAYQTTAWTSDPLSPEAHPAPLRSTALWIACGLPTRNLVPTSGRASPLDIATVIFCFRFPTPRVLPLLGIVPGASVDPAGRKVKQ